MIIYNSFGTFTIGGNTASTHNYESTGRTLDDESAKCIRDNESAKCTFNNESSRCMSYISGHSFAFRKTYRARGTPFPVSSVEEHCLGIVVNTGGGGPPSR